jgi:glycine hydroxymethyltransferase
MVASGIRIGTPAVTTRGMGEREMDEIAHLIAAVLSAEDDDEVVAATREAVGDLCRRFPLAP